MVTVRGSGPQASQSPHATQAKFPLSIALPILLAVGLLGASALGIQRQAPAAQIADDGARLIFHQQTQIPPKRTSPSFVAENIEYIETLPFDGITVDIPASLTLMRGEPIAYSEMYDQGLAPLKDVFSRMQNNFVMVYIDDPGDVFDDQAWAITVENWRHLARAAREAGLEGIFLDNEAYRQQWTDYPEDYASPAHSLEEYQAQTHRRGREIMEAMVSEFPAIKLLVFHGPYLSEPKTPRYVRLNQAGDASEHDLVGPFFIGFLDGLGDQASVIDGGEVYQYRTVDDFRKSYDWRKNGMPSEATDSAIIPEHLRALWPERVSISYGLYTNPFADTAMDPCIMQTTLGNALNQADDYVWLYTEEHNWLAPGGIPEIWADNIRLAVESVQRSKLMAATTTDCGARTLASTIPAARRELLTRDW